MKVKEKMNDFFKKSKKWILSIIGVFVAVAAGLGIYFAVEKLGEMTQEEAAAIVRDEHNGEVLSFSKEWDWEFGTPSTIEMAIKTEKGYEEIEMDASNGQILRREMNPFLSTLNSAVSEDSSTSTTSIIMPEDAIKRALKEVTGNVKEIELDQEGQRTIYEIEIEEGSREYDVHVDAATGSILMVSTES